MILNDMDPDVVQWNLYQLCMPSSSDSSSSVTCHDRDCGQVGCLRESCHQEGVSNIENDAVIARAYQEELTRLADAEASGYMNSSEATILGPPGRDQNLSGLEQDHKAADDSYQDGKGRNIINQRTVECSTDSREQVASADSSKEEKFLFEEDALCSIDITDESSVLDGEVGKRLNQMVPVPHVPKTNGEMLPSCDEAMSDHERLLERLKLYALVENKVQGDGNCQFCALSDQLYRSPDYHMFVREKVIKQLESDPEQYEGYVPMAYGDYLKKMSKKGEWGDHVTLQAAADSYGVKIFVVTSFKDTWYIEILPRAPKSTRVICLSFWAEVHYNSIYPEGELPMAILQGQVKKKKRWWMLGC